MCNVEVNSIRELSTKSFSPASMVTRHLDSLNMTTAPNWVALQPIRALDDMDDYIAVIPPSIIE